MENFMITVSKGLLKSKMLEYFRNVEKTGEELIVTDHSKPVLRISPLKKNNTFEKLFSICQGKAVYSASVTEPETEDWGDNA
jgi:antitoxin (DNA-binding transcriptional repressor) of toxin-antitoxin stability system